MIEGDYFSALGIPLLRGRVFGPQDRVGATNVTVVSESFAQALFPNEDPIGRWIGMASQFRQIIGVVADVPITARGPSSMTRPGGSWRPSTRSSSWTSRAHCLT